MLRSARARAGVTVGPANGAQALAVVAAAKAHGQLNEHELLRQVRYIEPTADQDVIFTERLLVATDRRIEPLVDGNVKFAFEHF